jgi:hypothetical protein
MTSLPEAVSQNLITDVRLLKQVCSRGEILPTRKITGDKMPTRASLPSEPHIPPALLVELRSLAKLHLQWSLLVLSLVSIFNSDCRPTSRVINIGITFCSGIQRIWILYYNLGIASILCVGGIPAGNRTGQMCNF